MPKSPLGQAIGYTLSQWTALTRYLGDGALAIDNNVAERALPSSSACPPTPLLPPNWKAVREQLGADRSPLTDPPGAATGSPSPSGPPSSP